MDRVVASARQSGRAVEFLVLAIFFTSGFAALLYQVIWQRALAHFSGADVYSITIIVTAFMAGLGCGSLAGGYLADRVSPRRRIHLFAFAEFAIAGFALMSLWFYHELLYHRLRHLGQSDIALPLVLFLSLLWPTFFMGMSLPLLARAMTHRIDRAASVLGSLYGINTLGAAAGAFIGTWIMIRAFGFEGSVRFGAILNAFAAVAALAATRSILAGSKESSGDDSRVSTHSPETGGSLGGRFSRVGIWFMIYGVSGFIALSLEIAWFRLVGVITKPTAFSFGNLLGIFLAGLAAGTFLGIRWARRSSNPALVFFGLQAAIPVYAALSLLVFAPAVQNIDSLSLVWNYIGQYEPVEIDAAFSSMSAYLTSPGSVSVANKIVIKQFITMYVIIPVLVIAPPTLMMGIAFPFLQKVVQSDLALLGRRVGWLQTANIFGSMAGAVLTGWVLLRFAGTMTVFRILLVMSILFLFLFLQATRRRRSILRPVVFLAIAAAISMAIILPTSPSLWATAHGASPNMVISAEDGSGLSLLKGANPRFTGATTVFANGLGQSDIPFPRWHIALGMVPILMHPDPQKIAVIGLGSGATLYAAGGRQETRSMHLIEIVAPQLETLRRLDRISPDRALSSLLNDSRISFRFADARRLILTGEETYDIIEADALRPTSAYAGNLYSEEYFELLKEHLKPGGFAVTWAPTDRVTRTFIKVFPNALLYRDANIGMLIGSREAIKWDPAAISQRLQTEFTRAYYARGGIALEQYISAMADASVVVFSPAFDRSTITDTNTDLFPRDEFLVRPSAAPLDVSTQQRGIVVLARPENVGSK